MEIFKKIKIIITTSFVATMLFTCSDDFLEEVPTQNVSTASATATVSNLNAIINGIHRAMYLRYDSQGEGGYGSIMIQNDVLGEDLVMTARSNGWFIGTASWNDHTNETSGNNEFPFETYYKFIRNANIILANADNADGPQDQLQSIKGQALVYRAWSHFQLVQLYGKRYEAGAMNSQLGVPIRLTDDSDPQARNTVEEVYTQVHKDLDEALGLLNAYSRPNKSHLDKSVALGVKARVYLVQGKWELAADFAKQARAGYNLMSVNDYMQGFNDYTNVEWMWGSHIQEDQTLFFANFGAYMSRNFSSTNIRGNPKAINRKLYNQIPASDVRSKIFDPTGNHNNLPAGYSIASNFSRRPFTSQKFLAVSAGDSRMDVPNMRAAEMYLIEAEALSHFNEGLSKQVLFELVSKRDPNYKLSTKSGQALKDEIYFQRRIELWGEGFRFFDLKRLNLPLDRTGANHNAALLNNVLQVPAGDNRWQWLIPRDALDSNPLLVQNPT